MNHSDVHPALSFRSISKPSAVAAMMLLAGFALAQPETLSGPPNSDELAKSWYARSAPSQDAQRRGEATTPVQIEMGELPSQQKTRVQYEFETAQRRSRLQSNAMVELPGGALQPSDPSWDEMVTLQAFVEPVEITALIEFVQHALEINIAIQGDPSGQIVLNAPIEIPKSRLIRLLDSMLFRFDHTIIWDGDAQLYVVQSVDGIPPEWEGELATAELIRTPNIKPSLIMPAVAAALGSEQSKSALHAIDELGVLMVTGSPKTVRMARTIIEMLVAEGEKLKLHRIELTYIAASTARTRAVGLAGGGNAGAANQLGAQNFGRNQLGEQAQAGNAGFTGGSLDNLADRLTVDATGNALLYRGVPEELEKVLEYIELIDVPNTLEAKNYFAGSSAQQIADIAKARGLGEVIILEAGQDNFDRQFQNFQMNQNGLSGQQGSGSTVGGPVMVVDIERGSIIYYGTAAQQDELTKILDDIKTDDDRIVIRTYELRHGKAEDIGALLDAIISGTQQTGNSALLPETRISSGRAVRSVFTSEGVAFLDGSGNDVSGDFNPDEVIIVPDIPNNQIIARAPIRQQDELARLIDQLDKRRKQVYVEALIISVSDTSNFRLAVETQILNGQYGLQTNFGLSSSGDDFLSQRSVASNLTGFTAALIQSESIPFIINAMQTDTDARVLSRPTLLVNDNEEGSIDSVEQQPTTSQSQGSGDSLVTSFSGFEDAGTNLTITPTISKNGYLTLTYEIEQSVFITAGGDGIPGAKATNNVSSTVTVPGNTTIVVGGIKTSNLTETIEKIPLLGDIPLLGMLFQDRLKVQNDSVLYIFLTPKIMTDPSFRDAKLFTDGPMKEVDAPAFKVPELEAVVIRPASIRPNPLPSVRHQPPKPTLPTDQDGGPSDDQNGDDAEGPAAITSDEDANL